MVCADFLISGCGFAGNVVESVCDDGEAGGADVGRGV